LDGAQPYTQQEQGLEEEMFRWNLRVTGRVEGEYGYWASLEGWKPSLRYVWGIVGMQHGKCSVLFGFKRRAWEYSVWSSTLRNNNRGWWWKGQPGLPTTFHSTMTLITNLSPCFSSRYQSKASTTYSSFPQPSIPILWRLNYPYEIHELGHSIWNIAYLHISRQLLHFNLRSMARSESTGKIKAKKPSRGASVLHEFQEKHVSLDKRRWDGQSWECRRRLLFTKRNISSL